MRSHHSSRRGNRRRLLQSAAVVVIVALVLYVSLSPRRSDPGARKGAPELAGQREMSKENFQRLLNEGNNKQLVATSLELTDQKDEPIAMRLDKLEKRIAISTRLIESNSDEQSGDFAKQTLLNALIDCELIRIENSGYDEAQNLKLRQVATSLQNDEAPAISNLALVVNTIALVSQYLHAIDSPTADDSSLEAAALNGFKGTATTTRNDLAAAKRMLQILQLIHSRIQKDTHGQFYQSYFENFSNSNNEQIVKLAVTASGTFAVIEQELVDVKLSVASERNAAVEKLMQQINDMLDRNEVADTAAWHILGRVEDLISIGHAETAREIQRQLKNKFDQATPQRIDSKNRSIERQLRVFERPFDVAGLRDDQDQKAVFGTPEATHRLFLFGSQPNFRESASLIRNLMPMTRGRLSKSELEMIVVFVHNSGIQDGLEAFRKLADGSRRIRFWLLDTDSDDGKLFLENFPIESLPCLVTLDKNNRIMHLNPSEEIVEEFLTQSK